MLIGKGPSHLNLERGRRIKVALCEALNLSHDTAVTVTEFACLEEGCVPIDTAIGLLRPNAKPLQCKLHKPTDAVDAEDLVQVCKERGFDVRIAVPAPPPQEKCK